MGGVPHVVCVARTSMLTQCTLEEECPGDTLKPLLSCATPFRAGHHKHRTGGICAEPLWREPTPLHLLSRATLLSTSLLSDWLEKSRLHGRGDVAGRTTCLSSPYGNNQALRFTDSDVRIRGDTDRRMNWAASATSLCVRLS